MNLGIDPLDPLKRKIEKEKERERKKESVELFTLLSPSVYNFLRSFEIFRIEGIKFYKVSRE